MPFEQLRSFFDDHAKREGNGWAEEHTKNALIKKIKVKLEADGLNSSTVNPPCQETIISYHAALVTMPDLVLCLYKPNNALRELLTHLFATCSLFCVVSSTLEHMFAHVLKMSLKRFVLMCQRRRRVAYRPVD